MTIREARRFLSKKDDLPYTLLHDLVLRKDGGTLLLLLLVPKSQTKIAEKRLLLLLDRLSSGYLNTHRLSDVWNSSRNYWIMLFDTTADYLQWLLAQPLIITETPPPNMSRVMEQLDAVQVSDLARRLFRSNERLWVVHISKPWWILWVALLLAVFAYFIWQIRF